MQYGQRRQIMQKAAQIAPAKSGENPSLEERRGLINMQDATIGSGVCTDLENLEIRGPAG